MKQRTLLYHFMLLVCLLVWGTGSAWGTDITYTFNSKSWGAKVGSTDANWTSGQDGNAINATQGIQVTSGTSGANATSPTSLQNISQVVVTYSTNSSKGAGSISIQVGSGTAQSQNVTTTGGTSDRTLTYNFSPNETGNVKITVTCSTNSIYVKSVKVSYSAGSGVATTTTIDASGLTNTNRYVGTSAGTLTASVTKTSDESVIDGATVTWSSSEESVATIDENTGEVTLVTAGTTTITASYAGVKDEFNSSSDTYELTVVNENPNMITLWSEDFSTSGYSDRSTTYSYELISSSVQSSDFYAGGTAPEMMVGKNGGTFTATIPLSNVVGDLSLKFKTNAKSITVTTSTANVSISGTYSFNTKEEHTVTFTGITTAMNSITITFAASSDNVRLDDITLKGAMVVPVTIGSHGYSTLISNKILDIDGVDGLTAYRAKRSDKTVTLTAVSEVDANKGIVLQGTASQTYNIPVLASTSANVDTDLTGDATDAYELVSGKYYYVLSYQNGAEGFYNYNGSAAIPAGKAFFESDTELTAGGGANYLSIIFDEEEQEETNAIGSIENGKLNIETSAYNLAGQKVDAAYKGIVIVNGIKYVCK